MKKLFLLLFLFVSILTNAQVTLTCESADKSKEEKSCWKFNALDYSNSSVISGKYSIKTEQLNNESPHNCYIITPWMK